MLDRQKLFGPYMKPHLLYSLWQLGTTVVLYFLSWAVMYLSLSVGYGWTLLWGVFAAGMLIRIFIIFHDCGHGSYFKSVKANAIVGRILGLFLWTPFLYWKRDHASHHGSVCNLDHYGAGDIWTMSVRDYKKATAWQRFMYRFVRNPIVLFFFAPIFLKNRFVAHSMPEQERHSIYLGNLWIILSTGGMGFLVGWNQFLQVQIPIFILASAMGSWLFYVQHQFDGAQWERSGRWDHTTAALKSTSYYDLPQILHWFTGNIGFHNVHHLSPRIPNYYLQKCHQENPLFKDVPRLTMRSSLAALDNELWDEDKREFVRFKTVRTGRK